MTARPKSQPLTLAPWLDDGYRHIWMPYTQMQTAPEPEAVTACNNSIVTIQYVQRTIEVVTG